MRTPGRAGLIVAILCSTQCWIDELLDTLTTNRMSTRNDDGRIWISFETNWALERIVCLQPHDDIIIQLFSTDQEVVFGNTLSRRLAEVLDQMRMATCLAETKQ